MQDLVTASMQQGAAGVSTGLIYPPNAFATLDELIALSTPAAALGGRYASHLRHDGKKLRDGIGEAIAIGEGAKIPVHVFHIKVTGQANFGRMKEVVALVEAAHARGVKLTADIYPYVASSTSLTATLPQWVMDGGADEDGGAPRRPPHPRPRAPRHGRSERRMGQPLPVGRHVGQRAAGLDRPHARRRHDRRVAESQVRGHARGGCGEGRRQGPVRLRLRPAGRDARQRVVRLLHHVGRRREAGDARSRGWRIGSDGSALSIEGPLRSGVPHPRNFGTFPRVLGKYVRDEKVIPLEEAIRKMTSLPAGVLNLPDRGTIAAGKWADLVIFDPATVRDTATFENPFSYPQGIDTVIVNGQVVLDEGTHTGTRSGKVLRRQ